jgi:hypothetical protein
VYCTFNLKIRGYTLLGETITLIFIGLVTPQAQSQTLSPLTEDQDEDGNTWNEEYGIRADCFTDHEMPKRLENPFGLTFNESTTLSEDDCNFVMHYLSGQCEEETSKGVNVTEVCDYFLSEYLKSRDLFTKDFPTDVERFNAVLDEFKHKLALEEQEMARESLRITAKYQLIRLRITKS